MAEVKLVCPKCNKHYTSPIRLNKTQEFYCKACRTKLNIISKPLTPSENAYARTLIADSKTKTPTVRKNSPNDKMTPFMTNIPPEVDEALASKGNIIAGKYVILEKIGRGGIGSVYKGWDITLKRYVAIKMILSAIIAESVKDDDSRGEVIGRFFREAQTSAKLIHPNILQVYEVGKQDDNYYIIMELVNRGTLDAYWGKKHQSSLPARENIIEYLVLMKSIAEAVDFAHRHNIIHRDIKPSNILLAGEEPELVPKIADFGLAKEITSDKEITVAGTIVGTPAYMSPEQANAEKLTLQSDVFSLGAVLYKLCTGEEPFKGASYLDIIKAVVNKDPAPPGAVNKTVDKDVETIILKAMEKDRHRRYAGAMELSEDIERYLQGEPVKARPASTFYRLSKKVRKNKIAAAGILLGIAALLAFIAITGAGILSRHSLADEYRQQAAALYEQRHYKEANDYYIKILELLKNDEEALEKVNEFAAKTAAEQEASKIAEDAWILANQVFPEFYKKNADMEKVWNTLDKAVAMLDTAINKYPAPMAYVYRAMINREKEQLIDAEDDLSLALKERPDFDLARIMKTIINVERLARSAYGTDKKITKDMVGKITLDDFLKETIRNFSEIDPKTKFPAQFEPYRIILNEYMKVIGEKRRFDYAFVETMVNAFEEHGSEEFLMQVIHIDPQEEYMDKIIELKPQSARGYYMRGVTRRIKKNFTGALDDLNTALRINKNFYAAYGERAVVKHNTNDLDGSLEDYDTFMKHFPDDYATYCDVGVIYTRKGSYKEAIAAYDRSIKLKNNYELAYRERGFVRAKIDDFDGAIADCSKAIELYPGQAESYKYRSFARSQKGDYEGSIDDMNMAVKLKPEDPLLRNERAQRHLDGHNFQRAIDGYTEAIELDPDFAEAYSNRALARLGLNDLNGAMADCTEAMRINPELETAYSTHALAAMNAKDYEKVIADYTILIRLSPGSAENYFRRGFAKKSNGDTAGAVEDYTKAIEIDGSYADAYNNRGVALYDLKRLDEAMRDYANALLIRPDYPEALNNRAIIKLDRNDPDGAIADSSQAIALKPLDYPLAYYTRGLAKKKKGDIYGAIADFGMAIDITPDANSFYERGYAYIDIGNLEKAMSDMNRAIELDPKHPRAYYERSYIKNNLGDFDGAFEDLSISIKNDPTHPDSWYGHGRISAKKGDIAGAIEDFTRAIQNKPDFVDAYLNRAFMYSAIRKYSEAIADYQRIIEISPETKSELETVITDLQNKMTE